MSAKNSELQVGGSQHDTRETILAAALEVYSRYGFRGATTRRIAEAAGVNEVTIFRHFGSKETLLGEALRMTPAGEPHLRLPQEPRDPAAELSAWSEDQLVRLRDKRSMILTSMGEIDERPALSEGTAGSLRAAYTELREYLIRVREAGMSCGDFDDHDAARTLFSALFSDAIGRDMLPEAYPPAQTAAHRYTMMILLLIGLDANRLSAQSDATGAPRG